MHLRTTLATGLLLVGCTDMDQTQSGSWPANGVGQGPPLSGAIFTTTSDGATVNENHYADKCDVYLNGGPAHEGSAGLPEGDYYFMVTDPSGNTLLSDDDVEQRQVHVDETGRFTGVSGLGDHDTSLNEVDGGATIQLCPYDDTPNPGGEYKVWVTPIADYEEGAGKHGFLNAHSKTDNFKVSEEGEEPPPPPPPPEEEDGPAQ